VTSTPNLGAVIQSPTARRWIYGVYIIAVFIIGCVQVGFAAVDAGQPDWLTVALAVAAYAGVPVGALAAANTSTSTGKHTE
jgi:hypothetical protein